MLQQVGQTCYNKWPPDATLSCLTFFPRLCSTDPFKRAATSAERGVQTDVFCKLQMDTRFPVPWTLGTLFSNGIHA